MGGPGPRSMRYNEPERQFSAILPIWLGAQGMDIEIPDGVFTRADLLESAMSAGDFRETQLRHLLGSLLGSGKVVRVGRGRYASGATLLPTWTPPYGETAQRTIGTLASEMPLLGFRVWELSWLNEFLNHLVARIAVVVAVEPDGCEFAFDVLSGDIPGRVLLRPSPDDFTRYGTDGCIVVTRLVSEAPGVAGEPHRAPIEQVVVDTFCDRLLRSILPTGDYPEAFQSMFERYRVDQPALFRYARRRGREDELREFLEREAGVAVYHWGGGR